jgi:GrpB-like predicted nucleotidyltransferase (UPF0157 family)
MKKYVFKTYSKIFPELFEKEKKRIASHVKGLIAVEHVGSTAVPNLGGKGIIDIAIAADRQNINSVSEQLQQLGYEFRPAFSTPDRLYFVIYLPDPEEEARRYHIHLMHLENPEWRKFIGFRDYLRNHPEKAEEYGEIKRKAALEANQNGQKYRDMKESVIDEINRKSDL